MKLVQFYLVTILVARNSHVCGMGYLTPVEMEYLSKRLYPAECSYLTTALSKSLRTNCKSMKKSSDDTLFDRPELHCLVKLEEWNEMSLKDARAHDHMENMLHEMGRFDLAAYLSKRRLYSPCVD